MPKPSGSIHAVFRTLPIIICFAVIACAPRKPMTSTAPSYRLQSINGGSLLLSPNIPVQQSADAPVTLALGASSKAQAATNICTANEGPFQVGPDSVDSNLRVTLPAPRNWLFGSANSSSSDENNSIESLYAFLADVDRSERAGCFATINGPARDYILQNIPTRPSDSLFNAYGYRIERSGVNLKPNLRLKVERAYFTSAERSDKNYLGVSDVLFDVVPDGNDVVRFKQVEPIEYSPASLAQTDREGSRDLAILDLKPLKHYRILFYKHEVPTDQNFSAAIIGADDSGRLDQFEQTMRVGASVPCTSSTHEEVQCMEFRGFVTVSIKIPVELNGQPKFVDWGTEVKYVVPAKSHKSLKIQRQFANSYFEVRFSPDDHSILDLALVGGDRLSW